MGEKSRKKRCYYEGDIPMGLPPRPGRTATKGPQTNTSLRHGLKISLCFLAVECPVSFQTRGWSDSSSGQEARATAVTPPDQQQEDAGMERSVLEAAVLAAALHRL
jgi:hypothetical protein